MLSQKMLYNILLAMMATCSLTAAQTTTEQYPSAAEIAAAQASVVPYSPVSKVHGKVFSRFVDIWLENTDLETAEAESHLAELKKNGIFLSNYWAVTHPSEPNYCAAAGGDHFGMDNDDWHQIPNNVSTIADLFDTKKLSWAEYQEALPYAGYQGFRYPESGPNNYVRKHNPLILFNSVTDDATRLRQIKNFTSFYDDLDNQRLPQYSFITPNMTNDGHDTNVAFSGTWSYNFLGELFKNECFMEDTLVLLTFDENGNKTHPNKVYSLLVGGAVPDHLKGTTDDTFYTHYSVIASLSANFDLPSLGRWDCGANLLSIVADKTGYINYDVDTSNFNLNTSYPGPLSNKAFSAAWPVPLTTGTCSGGRSILNTVKQTYHGLKPTYNYTSPVPYDAVSGTAVGVKYSRTGHNGKTEWYETA
ncbi:acid phosphatase, putative [Talaromyces stipitatus ATCC 10500]|uniref:acid phosphatase n=1 Tax=Talaromyces stipitatus (strain ATCC 10500 / CBS 375.48 / QM 6759 / NRRL 1006) TaxID=441959 RepID=B8MS76_TALSN|nr:acid phosphatase, putative [Talaromyces stipitatus ATCC 10500]EED12134.1 acid phosphatase, putative [Talaromyces stipitatus ATCC 10500]